jgi:hypothetical protein
MSDLDTRLRALGAPNAPPSAPPTPPGELRRRAAGRRRRRHVLLAVAAVVPVIAGIGVVLAVADDGPSRQQVVTDEGTAPAPDASPAPTTTAAEPATGTTPTLPPTPTGGRVIGALDGVALHASPTEGLSDGDLVEVRVDGLEAFPQGALLWVCAGDVTEADLLTACSASVQLPDPGIEYAEAQPEQVVSVGRVIRITRGSPDPNTTTVRYDCATEPAGCVLAVFATYEVPPRAVVVPLAFRADPLPTPAVVLSATSGLLDGQPVDVEATGLRPNAAFRFDLCTADGTVCDVVDIGGPSFSDASGRLANPVRAWAAIYDYDGRVDCTAQPCAVVVRDPAGIVFASVPIAFAPDVVAPEPRLTVDPPGPYVDGQVVTIAGHGFRPGDAIGSDIGQCPTGLDTAFEERCARPLAFQELGVDAAGSFTATIELSSSLIFTGTCVGPPGCHLGWVLPHGTTVAVTPLEFSG